MRMASAIMIVPTVSARNARIAPQRARAPAFGAGDELGAAGGYAAPAGVVEGYIARGAYDLHGCNSAVPQNVELKGNSPPLHQRSAGRFGNHVVPTGAHAVQHAA